MRVRVILAVAAIALAVTVAPSAAAPIVVGTGNATTLVNTLLGPGVSLVGAPTLIAATNQVGTFTNGAADIGFASGIVISTGLATQIPGPNVGQPVETLGVGSAGPNLSTNLGTPGDTQLDTLTGGHLTHDAGVLEFDFQFGDGTKGGNSLFFNFVFGSEEYIDWVGSSYNDVFAFYVDGTNIGIVPGDGPITVNNVNPTAHSAYYKNNIANTNGYPVANLQVKLDGLTTVIQANLTNMGPGTHHMKFAIADAQDAIYDSAVFVQAGTFTVTPTDPIVPEPASLLLLGSGLFALRAWRKHRS